MPNRKKQKYKKIGGTKKMKRKYLACEVRIYELETENVIRTSQNGVVAKDHFDDSDWWITTTGGAE